MAGAPFSLEGDQPHLEEHARVIDCPVSVLQNLRASVLERFNATPQGGGEVTGVLFGTRSGDELRITAFCAVASHGDLEKSEALAETARAVGVVISAAESQKELEGLEPLGWFRAHPRSDLNLTGRDLEIVNHLFSQPWQVALVMRPGNAVTSYVRFYFREREGPWTADCAVREFTVLAEELQPPRQLTAETREARDLALVAAQQPPSHMSALLAPPEARRAARFPAVAVTVVALAAAAGGFYYWYMRPQPLGLTVRATESAAQVRIAWDRTAAAVSRARAAYLEIADGGQNERLDLDPEQLQIGYVNYPRHSDDMTVRLVLTETNGDATAQEMAHFAAPLGTAPAAAPPAVPPAAEVAQNPAPVEGADGADGAAEKTPELVVPVPVDTGERAETENPLPAPTKFRPPVARPVAHSAGTAALEEPPAPAMTAAAEVAHGAPSPLVSQPVAHTPPPPVEKPAPASAVPATQSPARNAAPRAPAMPGSGRVIWIGRLQKNQPLILNGKSCSMGTLIGELPARPFKFSISPGDLSADGIVLYTSNLQYANSVVEPPGAHNGWNKTVYTWNPKYANDVSIDEGPAAQSGWSRLVLHSKNPKISVIVIDWTAVN